jgi:ribosome-binding protein aMBF1 (putative translation factor)
MVFAYLAHFAVKFAFHCPEELTEAWEKCHLAIYHNCDTVSRYLLKAKAKKTTDALAILDRMAGGSAELRRLTEEARINAAVAQLIYAARMKASLSQAELAERIGTKQSVISRLEDADYEGHSLNMLQRIAGALGQRLEIRFLSPVRPWRGGKPGEPVLKAA